MQLRLFQDKKFLVIYEAKAFDSEGNYQKDNLGSFIYEVYKEIRPEPELELLIHMLKITEARNIRVHEYKTQNPVC
jgi:hypothetical protein